jgi:SAM-dependent methyltransferase
VDRVNLRPELMDDPSLPLGQAERALDDLGRVHRWVGNAALWRQLVPVLLRGGRCQRLIDVGTGNGGLAAEARSRAEHLGVSLSTIGVDRKLGHLVLGRRRHPELLAVVADARALPFADGAVDVTASSYFQHHFDRPDGGRVLAEMRRVARRAVVVADIRRSTVGGVLGRVVMGLLRLGPVASYDGRVSLDQSWTEEEVRSTVPAHAIVELRRRWPFRWSLELRPGCEPPAS